MAGRAEPEPMLVPRQLMHVLALFNDLITSQVRSFCDPC